MIKVRERGRVVNMWTIYELIPDAPRLPTLDSSTPRIEYEVFAMNHGSSDGNEGCKRTEGLCRVTQSWR